MKRLFLTLALLIASTQTALAADIRLAWDPVDPAPTGYRIYQRTGGESYDYSTPLWEGPESTCMVTVPDGVESAFVARAYILEFCTAGAAGSKAYLITGDYFHLETMEYQAATIYLANDSSQGSGTSRMLYQQDRSVAWSNRTVGQLAAIGPSDDIVDDFVYLLSTQVDHWNTVRQSAGMNALGFLYSYQLESNVYGTGKLAPWMHHFWVATYGYLSDLEPLSSMTNLNAVRDHLYKIPVGMLGPNGTDYYCFNDASQYEMKVSATQTSDPADYYDSWGTVYEETTGSPNTSCANILDGSDSGVPTIATGYWANLLPAIAYAVEDGATGASDAWTRMTGATNFSTFESAGFDDAPVWGIYPRSIGEGGGSGEQSLSLSGGSRTISTGGSRSITW